MTAEQKKWIDEADYETFLRRWRNSAVGDTIFQGEAGLYFAQVMAEKRVKIGQVAAVQASKTIGWDG